MSYSLNALYRSIGVSKQSVHQSLRRQLCFDKELEDLVDQADLLKKEHPGCGVEKMYCTLKPKLMGRDKFCEIFLSLGYGVKKVKNYRRTTYSGHLSYPDLQKGLAVIRPSQLIESDITYFDVAGKFYYLVFLIDVYTREIVGYHVGNHMRTVANIKALNMALSKMKYEPWGLIHHSDRGCQYSSNEYREQLKKNNIYISMSKSAYENPYAERINGIIKNEYLKLWSIKNETELKRKTKKAVNHYNSKRKHRAHGMKFSPEQFAKHVLSLNPQDRPMVNIYTEGKLFHRKASSLSDEIARTDPQAHSCPMN